jgi:hypothetical protein
MFCMFISHSIVLSIIHILNAIAIDGNKFYHTVTIIVPIFYLSPMIRIHSAFYEITQFMRFSSNTS